MKRIIKVILISVVLLNLVNCSGTKKIKSENGISQIQFLELGGVKQYVLIRGEDMDNPVLLFLHGGPGASATALLRKFNSDLEKDFTVVYWDQRGAGKSYDKLLKPEDIQVNHYKEDLHEITEYLKNRFKKEKIYLIGHSWGSRLGLYAIHEKPWNYHAYIGVGQELQSYRGELSSYRYTLEKAKEVQNKKALRELEEMGEPGTGEYKEMYKTGFWGLVRQKHWLLKLGGERFQKRNYLDWILAIWFSREYSFSDFVKYTKGSAFSAGTILDDPEFNNIDLFEEIPEIDIPVYFISGSFDFNTPWPIVKEYYQHVKAPDKEFILFDKSGHSPVFEEPERFNREVINLFLKRSDNKVSRSIR